jgi:hypothetical protein
MYLKIEPVLQWKIVLELLVVLDVQADVPEVSARMAAVVNLALDT